MSMFVLENNIIWWKDQKCTFYPCEKNDEAATPNIRLSDWPISGKISIRCIPSIDPCHPENLVSLCNKVLKIRITRRKIFQTLQFFWLFWETRGECVCGMCVDFPEVKTANQRPAWVPEMRDQPHHSTISPDKRDMTHYGICFMHDDIQNIQHTL